MWRDSGISVDFTVLKHQLSTVKEQFEAEEYYHIGDTDMDKYFSEKAGFDFLFVDVAVEGLPALTAKP